MAGELRLRRGTSTAMRAFTGVDGELTLDVTRKGLVVHDGATPGGFLVPTESETPRTLAGYDVIRTYTGRAHTVCINRAGVAGTFFHDETDTTSDDDGGLVLVDTSGRRWKRMSVDAPGPRLFGAKGDGVAFDTVPLRLAVASSVRTGLPLDLRGGVWKIDGTIDMTGIRTIRCDFQSALLVARTGKIADSFAVTLGLPGKAGYGRNGGVVIEGQLSLVCESRDVPQCGIYVKGSWFHCGHLHADNFNGTGIHMDSVWDSTFNRIRVERCGNVSKFALVVDSAGDTSNCLNITSLQCEQSYHRGLDIKVIRAAVQNIHCERTVILTLDDGTPRLQSGKTYLNHRIELGNSEIRQAYFDAVPAGTVISASRKGTTPTGQLSMTSYNDASSFSTMAIGGELNIVGGSGSTFDELAVENLFQHVPASGQKFGGLAAGLVSVESFCEFQSPRSIRRFDPCFNALGLKVFGGRIDEINFSNAIMGDIVFTGTEVGKIYNVGAPAAGRLGTTFHDCRIGQLVGAFNSRVRVNNGYVHDVVLASQAIAELVGVQGNTFAFRGNAAFLTRDCQFTKVANWSLPLAQPWPAGTRTSRPYFLAGQPIDYINRDSSIDWVALRAVPA